MSDRNMKSRGKPPEKSKPTDKRRRSVVMSNEMLRERQVSVLFCLLLLFLSTTSLFSIIDFE